MTIPRVGTVRRVDWIVPLACIWSIGGIWTFDRFGLMGSVAGIVAALMFALAPILLNLALRAPLLFPFCAYVLVLPVDSLSRFSSFGTVSKVIGIFCVVAVVVHLALRRTAIPVPGVLFCWAALLAWMAVTVMWAPSAPEATLAFWQYLTLVALLAVLTISPVTKAELIGICTAVVVAGAGSSAYQIYLFHTGQSVMHDSRVEFAVGEYHIDPNEYAASLVLPLAVALYALFEGRSKYVKAGALLASVLILGGLAAAASRGGILSALLMVGYFAARSRHMLKFVIVVCSAISGTLAFNPGIVTRFAAASANEGAGRGDIWRTGLQAFRERWFAGWGIGGFPSAFDANHLGVFTSYQQGWHWHAHNSILTVATELGAVGLILWCTALVLQFRLGRLVGPTHEFYELRVAFEAAFLGVFLAGCFTTNFNAKYTWLAYAMLAFLRGYAITCRVGRSPARSLGIASALQRFGSRRRSIAVSRGDVAERTVAT